MANSNTIDPALLAGFVKRVEAEDDVKASLQGKYMNDCAQIAAKVKAIKKDAKDAGINMKEFNTLLKDRGFDRKKEALRSDLEPDQLAVFDSMKEGLKGLKGLPLGDAALATQAAKVEEQQQAKAAPIDNIGRGPAVH